MRYIGKYTLCIVIAVVLSACAGAQKHAGITEWSIEPTLDCPENQPLCYKVSLIDGKEKQEVRVRLSYAKDNKLTVSYTASDVRAFPAHEIRAGVEKALIETIGEAAPAVVDAIITAIMKAVVPIP